MRHGLARTRFGRSLSALGVAALALSVAPAASGQCQLQKLVDDAGFTGDQFGDSVAVSGDWMFVGASRDDTPQDSGAVHVYRFEGTMWTPFEILKASDRSSNDLFGWSVDLDVDAPEGPVAVVGAYLSDDPVENGGKAYVYRFYTAPGESEPRWHEEAQLTSAFADPGAQLGRTVAIDDEWIVAGVERGDMPDGGGGEVIDAGWAEVWQRQAGVWTNRGRLVHPAPQQSDRTGTSVDVDATTRFGPTIVVGSTLDETDTGPANAGSVLVFRYDGADWGIVDILSDFEAGVSDGLGISVAISDDVVVAGAWLADFAGTDVGAVLAFRDFGSGWQEWTLVPAVSATGDQFGRTVAITDDPSEVAIPGDKLVVIGATGVDAGASGGGGAFLFGYDSAANFWSPREPLLALDAGPGDSMGNAVSIDGTNVVVGARSVDGDSGPNSGAAYTFEPTGIACTDCDGDFVADFLQWMADPSLDCDGDEILDVCQISVDSTAPGGPWYCIEDCDPDCNNNGVPDLCDIANGTSTDDDIDGIPDECQDCNGNGFSDIYEITVLGLPDCNGNLYPDECDIAEAIEEDCDANLIPDACQIAELDGDGDPTTWGDCDGNGILDACEDCDGNGVADICDIGGVPDYPGPFLDDLDGNGVPDTCEDCDGDGVIDLIQIISADVGGLPDLDCDDDLVLDVCQIAADSPAPGGPWFCVTGCDPDCNVNGILDWCETEDGSVPDENGNNIPDSCEDCNQNGVPDSIDVLEAGADCDGDGVPDECQISFMQGEGFFCVFQCDPDCNENGIPDACDISGGMPDIDGNGVPDECDPDCDGNGEPDAFQIQQQPLLDLDGNGVLDICQPDCDGDAVADFIEILQGAPDCNENGVPDSCDIDSGGSSDSDGDGIPDECEDQPGTDGDATGDGVVGFADLLIVLGTFGACPAPPEDCSADFDQNGSVDFADLLVVLGNWTE